MLAFVGFCSQAAVYGKGPIETLQLHLADPGHNNSESFRAGGGTRLEAEWASRKSIVYMLSGTVNSCEVAT
jgi:hypothetical protein